MSAAFTSPRGSTARSTSAAGPTRAVRAVGRFAAFVVGLSSAAALAATPADVLPVTRSERSVKVANGRLGYTVEAGLVQSGGGAAPSDASIRYTSYVASGSRRPITFLLAGDRSGSGLWLHFGSFAPVRMTWERDVRGVLRGATVVENPQTLIDRTDLVFFDAAATDVPGGPRTPGAASVDADLVGFAAAVRNYLRDHHRMGAPLYLVGEGYGGGLAASLALILQRDSIRVSGLALLSPVLNYGIDQPGFDRRYIGLLPSYAAIAWFHGKPGTRDRNLMTFVDEAQRFAEGPFAEALAAGDALPAGRREVALQETAAFSGMPTRYLRQANLRMDVGRYRSELLRDAQIIVGLADGRSTGVDRDGAGEDASWDPATVEAAEDLSVACSHYVAATLRDAAGAMCDVAADPIPSWDYQHRGLAQDQPQHSADFGSDLAIAMQRDRSMRVFVGSGLFDLESPFSDTRYDVAHLGLQLDVRSGLVERTYPTGHHIYLDDSVLAQLRSDIVEALSLPSPPREPRRHFSTRK